MANGHPQGLSISFEGDHLSEFRNCFDHPSLIINKPPTVSVLGTVEMIQVRTKGTQI